MYNLSCKIKFNLPLMSFRSHSWQATLLVPFTMASDQATLESTSLCNLDRKGGQVDARKVEKVGTGGCPKYHLLHWWASKVSFCFVVVRFLTSLPTLAVLVKFTWADFYSKTCFSVTYTYEILAKFTLFF